MHPFIRTERLLGRVKYEKLTRAHVLIVGIGGVGSHVTEALMRSGVGFLTLVDFDKVSSTDLNRQVMALHSTLGLYKVEAMRFRIKDVNPLCKVQVHISRFHPDQLTLDVDYIVDAIDEVSEKVRLIAEAKKRNIPIVSSMGTGNKQDPSQLQITDISKTHTCPLARIVRKQLRTLGLKEGLDVLTSTEPPRRFSDQDPTIASIATVPPCAGLLLAAYVIDKLTCPEQDMKERI